MWRAMHALIRLRPHRNRAFPPRHSHLTTNSPLLLPVHLPAHSFLLDLCTPPQPPGLPSSDLFSYFTSLPPSLPSFPQPWIPWPPKVLSLPLCDERRGKPRALRAGLQKASARAACLHASSIHFDASSDWTLSRFSRAQMPESSAHSTMPMRCTKSCLCAMPCACVTHCMMVSTQKRLPSLTRHTRTRKQFGALLPGLGWETAGTGRTGGFWGEPKYGSQNACG